MDRQPARSGLRWGRHAKFCFKRPHSSSFCLFCFPESTPAYALIFAHSVRQTPAFPIDSPQAVSQRSQVLRKLPFARSFLAAPRRHPVRCIGAAQSCGIAMAWNGGPRTCRYQSLPAAAGPGNRSLTIQFASGSHSLRMAHAGCLRSTGRLKSRPVRSLCAAITSGVFRQFERRADMKSFRLSGLLEKN